MYSATTCRHLLMINWKFFCSLIDDAVSMVWYRNIRRRMTCTPVLFIPAYIKSVAWLYVCTYLHKYIYACTYMHIFNGHGFYSHFMILFTIYHLHNITSECLYHITRCYFMMLNFKCHILPFYHVCWYYLKCILCITIIICFVSNDEIKMFNQSIKC